MISPPPDRAYRVWATIPGPTTGVTQADLDALSQWLRTKASEGLRRGVSDLALDFGPDGKAAVLTALVNEWNAATAAVRVVTLLGIRAGEGWDVHGASVTAGPLLPQPDIPVQERTPADTA